MSATAPLILVVDDYPTNLKLVAAVLELEGLRVLTAADAEEAQLIVARTPPDLILMDVALPGMDGLTLTRHLKADPNTRHIRTVAFSAFAMKGEESRAIAAGSDGYLTKPIDTRQFGRQLAGFLDGAHRAPGTVRTTEARCT